ncbi:glycerophosphodiester phosphodiesterase [Actinoalloteichus spitiensis]|uniref:glycerophosphodiester phosphodiesterase n=1 Tax=Actinoalloteichus spitiensis TaxID=252394 RepID=UPI0003701CA8|nr:glycerophosphodiester phosphodiesterase family protein [Actinoalloteichus spitiensis]
MAHWQSEGDDTGRDRCSAGPRRSTVGRGGLIAAAALVGASLLAPTSAAATGPAPDPGSSVSGAVGPEVVAHRGASGSAPENTLAAIRAADEIGADQVEIDVQRTADGEIVLMHDCTLNRTTDVEDVFPGRDSYAVADFTLDELSQLDAGSWFGPEFAGEPVPTLREAVRELDPETGLLLEVKVCAGVAGLGADIARELRSMPGYLWSAVRGDTLVVQSFDHEQMRAFHRRLGVVPVGLLFGSRPSDAELVAASRWAEQANPRFRDTDPALVDRVHELGMAINVWTVNDEADMRTAVSHGVDGVITDHPEVLLKVLGRD